MCVVGMAKAALFPIFMTAASGAIPEPRGCVRGLAWEESLRWLQRRARGVRGRACGARTSSRGLVALPGRAAEWMSCLIRVKCLSTLGPADRTVYPSRVAPRPRIVRGAGRVKVLTKQAKGRSRRATLRCLEISIGTIVAFSQWGVCLSEAEPFYCGPVLRTLGLVMPPVGAAMPIHQGSVVGGSHAWLP